MTRAIHQLITALSYGDAISDEALAIRAVVRELGYESKIYGEFVDDRLSSSFTHFTEYEPQPEDILIFHFSIGSNLTRFVGELPGRLILLYHNMTPAAFFRGYNAQLETLLESGRQTLAGFRTQAVAAWADSTYNAEELTALGFDNVSVLPILRDLSGYAARKPDPATLRHYRDGKVNLLFVGRIAPNKRQDNLIRTFALLHKFYRADVRLILAGKAEGMETYQAELERLVAANGVDDVVFTGQISESELVGLYRSADLFVSMSEHEGFMVPLIEAAYFEVPIVAYSAGAVPETLSGQGIALPDTDIEAAAATWDRVLSDPVLHKQLVQGQKQILKKFDHARTKATLTDYLKKVTT